MNYRYRHNQILRINRHFLKHFYSTIPFDGNNVYNTKFSKEQKLRKTQSLRDWLSREIIDIDMGLLSQINKIACSFIGYALGNIARHYISVPIQLLATEEEPIKRPFLVGFSPPNRSGVFNIYDPVYEIILDSYKLNNGHVFALDVTHSIDTGTYLVAPYSDVSTNLLLCPKFSQFYCFNL